MIRVGVIRGGISPEYEVSLQTGGRVLRALAEKLASRYSPVDILIDREGLWHVNGLPSSLPRIQHSADVFFNALHGAYGEDGKIQQLLDSLGMPYTGSGPLPSAVGMNKILAKERFRRLGLKTPRHKYVFSYERAMPVGRPAAAGQTLEKYLERSAYEVFQKLPPPWIVKPVSGGSSIGVSVCNNFAELVLALWKGMEAGGDVLVEEFIQGKEATCGVVDGFRGQKTYALLPTEIKKSPNKSWGYEEKYNGKIEEICPGNFSKEEGAAIQDFAVKIHEGFGLRHYSRSDFIIHPRRGIYVLEVNTLPGLTENSLVPRALEQCGCPFHEFLDHILTLAFNR